MNYSGPYSGVLWYLLLGVFCVNIAQGLSIPFLILYLTHNTHCSLWLSGFVVGVAPFFSIWGGFIGGQLSDRYGRLFLMYLSVVTTALVFMLFGLAFQIKNEATQWGLILILNALFGLFSSFFQPSVMALMSDLVAKEYREQMFHLRYAAMNMGAIIGPLIGVFLGIALSPSAFFLGGIIYLAYGCALYGIVTKNKLNRLHSYQKSISFRDSVKVVLTDKKLLHFILFHVFFALCYSQLTSTLSYYVGQKFAYGTKVYSFLITLNALCVVLGQAPVYLLCKKQEKNKIIFYGCILFFLGCLGFSYAETKVHFYLSMGIITLGELLVFPFSSSFIDDMAPVNLKGTYFGALTFRELGLALGPILGGILLELLGGSVFFLIIGLLALGAYYFVVLYERAKYRPMITHVSCDEGV